MRSGSLRLAAPLAALALACGGSGAPSSFTLSVAVDTGGSVTGSPTETSCASGSCATTQPRGGLVVLTPVSASGFTFTGWTGDCKGSGLCIPTVNADRSVTATFAPTTPVGSNILPLTVNGETCGSGAGAYANKPCVRVTVCLPGTSRCTTVDDVLLDTGSYGLRLFKEVLPFALTPVAAGGGTLAECVAYLDGNSHWGPVAVADVRLGGEPVVQIPIQVIDHGYGAVPSSCKKPETGPTNFNGVLGVGLKAEDCGPDCVSFPNVGIYFACTGASCTGTRVPLASQVPNPVSRLLADNNGVVVELPAVPLGGQASATGNLILGIDTQANNSSAGAIFLQADLAGNLRAAYDGKTTLDGFLDTGSNGYFFPAPSAGSASTSGPLPPCASPNGGWFCPASLTNVSVTNTGYQSGAQSLPVTFQVDNALRLFASNGNVFSELGGALTGTSASSFDFGLPFFFGRRVFVVLEGNPTAGGAPERSFGY